MPEIYLAVCTGGVFWPVACSGLLFKAISTEYLFGYPVWQIDKCERAQMCVCRYVFSLYVLQGISCWGCSGCLLQRVRWQKQINIYNTHGYAWVTGGPVLCTSQAARFFLIFWMSYEKRGRTKTYSPCVDQNVPLWDSKTYPLRGSGCFPGGLHRQCTVQITSCQPQIVRLYVFSWQWEYKYLI